MQFEETSACVDPIDANERSTLHLCVHVTAATTADRTITRSIESRWESHRAALREFSGVCSVTITNNREFEMRAPRRVREM